MHAKFYINTEEFTVRKQYWDILVKILQDCCKVKLKATERRRRRK